ncbi:MAG: ADP-ribosylglycohydrolase family protein [Methanobrevibacter sp.]|nr:ADP-ribosylglycohydrolase family protein [Methanobrevibacter sp.]
MEYYEKIKGMLFGIAIGDALGVPVEFESRKYLAENPVNDMIGFGTYHKPPGSFSDDSSLTFTLVESLINGYDLEDIAQNMVKWFDEAFWTAYGNVFDVGTTTRNSIYNIKNGVNPTLSGETKEYSNGNGSLMRIAPLVFILMFKPKDERFQIIKEVSAITHGHIRSVIACFYFLEFIRYLLLDDLEKHEIYHILQEEVPLFLKKHFKENDEDLSANLYQISYFDRLLKENIYELEENSINSGGHVIDTIEASIWCLLTTVNYSDAVLKAVNLGGDTDTTSAVT